jgi:hypothetical protein
MICPMCGHVQEDGIAECQKCGVIFNKIMRYNEKPKKDIEVDDPSEQASTSDILKGLFFSVKTDPDPIILVMKTILLMVIFVWGLMLFFTPIEEAGNNILHYVNLPFHEAGHIFFRLFGEFFTVLGGSLFQLIMPMICVIALLLKTRDPFGASVALWWFGENFIDLAPYINDARSLELVLLGGVTGRDRPGFHDWENILGTLGLLDYDHIIAHSAMWFGLICMMSACAWAGCLLFKELSVMKQGRRSSGNGVGI